MPTQTQAGHHGQILCEVQCSCVQLAFRMAVKILHDTEVPEGFDPKDATPGPSSRCELRRCDEKGSLGGHLGRSPCSFCWDGGSQTLQCATLPAVPVENADPGPLLPHQNVQSVCLQADPLGYIFSDAGRLRIWVLHRPFLTNKCPNDLR